MGASGGLPLHLSASHGAAPRRGASKRTGQARAARGHRPRTIAHGKARSPPRRRRLPAHPRGRPRAGDEVPRGDLRAHDDHGRRRAVRRRHEDGVVQARGAGRRDRASSRLHRLREERGRRRAPFLAERGAARHRAAAGHQGEDLLHRLPDQWLWPGRPGRQSDPEGRELKGKIIGVTNLASAGVVVARAQVAAAGLDRPRRQHRRGRRGRAAAALLRATRSTR